MLMQQTVLKAIKHLNYVLEHKGLITINGGGCSCGICRLLRKNLKENIDSYKVIIDTLNQTEQQQKDVNGQS